MLLPNFLVAFSEVRETCETSLKVLLTHMRSITRILTQTIKVMNFNLFELSDVNKYALFQMQCATILMLLIPSLSSQA